MKYKINCYLTEISKFIKELKTEKDEYLDIKNDFGKINLLLYCSDYKINLEKLKDFIDFSKPCYIWLDDGTYYFKKINIKE